MDFQTKFSFLKKQYKSEKAIPMRKKTNTVKLPSVKTIANNEFGNYIAGDMIGEGAFAKVRICTRKSDKHVFVMKMFEKFRLNTEEKKKAIFREIEILKSIDHPNIIKIIDFFETYESIIIVMEHFSLTSLLEFTKKNRPLCEELLREIVRQIAEAIDYLHTVKGIAHRDLKPENILISNDHQIKIIDLGLASTNQQKQLKVAGTTYYMSPELISRKNYEPFKADIWAFGVMLYWVVLGYFPQNNQQKQPSKKKKKTERLFHLKFPIDMHPGIQYLISKMLTQDPEQRIDAQQILRDTWVKPKNFKKEISKLLQTKQNFRLMKQQ